MKGQIWPIPGHSWPGLWVHRGHTLSGSIWSGFRIKGSDWPGIWVKGSGWPGFWVKVYGPIDPDSGLKVPIDPDSGSTRLQSTRIPGQRLWLTRIPGQWIDDSKKGQIFLTWMKSQKFDPSFFRVHPPQKKILKAEILKFHKNRTSDSFPFI